MSVRLKGFLPLARRIARRAGAALRVPGGTRLLSTNPLGQTTIEADVRLEGIVEEELRRARIPCTLVTEEAGTIRISGKPEWTFVLDPLDGSENYKRGMPPYAIGLCYAPAGGRMKDVLESYVSELAFGEEFYARKGAGAWRDGERIHGSKVRRLKEAVVSLDIFDSRPKDRKWGLFEASDYRRFGPDLVDMCYTACGRTDGFVVLGGKLSAVHACGVGILSETCVVTDLEGRKVDSRLEVEEYVTVVAAGTRQLHSGMLAAIRK